MHCSMALVLQTRVTAYVALGLHLSPPQSNNARESANGA